MRSCQHKVFPLKASDRAVYEVPSLGVIATTGGHGKVNMALSTQKMILDYSRVENVICLGTAGALGTSVKALDVVIGCHTVEHDYKTPFANKSPQFKTSVSMQEFQKLKESLEEPFRVYFGPIASGDENITSNDRAKELKVLTQALAVAWEGAGTGRACKKHNKKFYEIRGLSDTANSEASFDCAKNLPKAMANATKVLLHLIEKGQSSKAETERQPETLPDLY